MPETTPQDLSREIERLWARVGTTTAAAASAGEIAATPDARAVVGAEVAWETVALLKRQSRERERSWQAASAAHGETARVLRERLDAAEAELSRRRESESGDEELRLLETLDARERVEAAQKAMAAAQARHDEERGILEDALRSLRDRLAAEAARARAAEQRWQERELERETELRELRLLADSRREEGADANRRAQAAREGVAQAKDALERTLAELLLERRRREESEREVADARRRVDELQAHVEQLAKLWEEERGQWRALWERERAAWEERRAELARLEDAAAREREAWRAERQAEAKSRAERGAPPSEPPPPAPSAPADAAPPAAPPDPNFVAPVPRDWRRALKDLFPFAVF
ncbi:MAG: hypothetical protein HKL90_05035 [Elusimicrobia bacterium]|nr:hypothetical protein [Elusimicrobiota bacterium]